MNKNEFVLECKKIGINISSNILNKLDLYFHELVSWNNKFNLTTIINEEDVYLKHFYDSLCLVKVTNLNNKNICDFGTGAGFPGMVIAIVFDKSNITLIE